MSLDFSLDHIGIAVSSLEEGKKFYEALGLGPMTVETVPQEKVRVGFFALKNGARLELLEPLEPSSPVAQFLNKKGPGVHHICLQVKDIRAASQQLRMKGMKLIYDEPRIGAHNCLVNFVHPSSTGGVLLELSQKAEKGSGS